MRRIGIGAIAALALCTSCVSFRYNHSSVGSPIDEAALETIEPGTSDLTTCLEALGAPELVWPAEDGMIHVAYAWIDTQNWGLAASWSFNQFVAVNTSFDAARFDAESV